MGKGAPDNKYPAAQAIWLVMLMLCSSMLPFIPPALEAEGKVANTGSSTPTITLVRGFQIIETSPLIQNSSIEEWEMYPSPPNGIALNDGTDMKPLDGDRSHTCAILDNGSMACWGQNSHHELGDQTTCSQYVNNTDCPFKWGKNSPVYVNFSDQVLPVSVDTGYERTCAIMSDHSVRCWGREYALGPNNVSLTSIFNPSAITVGEESVCIVLTDGNVQCLGKNGYGQLGNSSRVGNNWNSTFADVSLPVNRSAVRIASEYRHACALLDNGSVACWGDNEYGQLGDWSVTDSTNNSVFARLPQNRTAVDIDVGQIHSCAVLDNGSVFCWGRGTYGMLGNGIHSTQGYPNGTFVSLPENRTVSQLDLGSSNACALLDNGSILCWGDYKGLTPTIQPLPLNTTALRVEATGDATCAVLANHTTNCWVGFSNSAIDRGVLGDGTWVPKNSTSSLPVNFSIGRTVDLSLLAGSLRGVPSNLQSLTNYTVWGNTSSGGSQSLNFSIEVLPALDYGNSTISLTRNTTMTPRTPVINGGPYNLSIWPTLPPGLHFNSTNGTIWGTPSINLTQQTFLVTVSNSSGSDNIALQIGVVDISPMVTYASLNHTFVRGFNISTVHATQTGGNVESGVASPELPEGLHLVNPQSGVASISTGKDHTCAILDNGSLWCWGRGNNWQLGAGYLTNGIGISGRDQVYPQSVILGVGRTAVAVSAGEKQTCAILDNGSLNCWGSNYYGQFGTGGTGGNSAFPIFVDIGSGRSAVAVTTGLSHTCAILDNGSLYCWGRNDQGQLGLGNTTNHNSPQFVDLGIGRTAIAVRAANDFTCAILDDGSLKCWGHNYYGQLGLGNYTSTGIPTPQLVNLGIGRTATMIGGGANYNCAILDNGSLNCWGYNDNGELGLGYQSNREVTPHFVDLGTGRTALSISQGLAHAHSCAVLDNGSTYCWGSNGLGQLGDGTQTNHYTPYPVNLSVGRTAVAVDAGEYHTCAILDNGSMNCWGRNIYGQLGIGNDTEMHNPTQVEGMNGLDWNLMGSIIGKSRVFAPWTTYTLWANNSVGNHSTNMSITVVQALDYGNGSISLARNATMTPRTPIMNGGPYAVTVSPPLPSGLSLNNTTGEITGTPTLDQILKQYTITATNSSGSDQFTIYIGVADIPPSISYSNSNYSFIRGWAIDSEELINDGGNINTLRSNETMPLGLTINEDLMSRTTLSACGYWQNACKQFRWFIGSDGLLYGWGDSFNSRTGWGNFGHVSGLDSYSPTVFEFVGGSTGVWPQTNYTAIEVGMTTNSACVLLVNGTLACWGGVFGFNQTSEYCGSMTSGGLSSISCGGWVSTLDGQVQSLATDASNACAILYNESLWCWGSRVGSNLTNGIPQYIDLGGRAVAQTRDTECVLLRDGNITCWSSASSNTNISLPAGRKAISIGYDCAILDNQSVYCWTGSITWPTIPNGLQPIRLENNGCMILSNGSAYCVPQTGAPFFVPKPESRTYVALENFGVDSSGLANAGCGILDNLSIICFAFWTGNGTQNGTVGTIGWTTMPNNVVVQRPDSEFGLFTGTPLQEGYFERTIWGNNSLGASSFNMNIEVLLALDYGNPTIGLTRNVTMPTATPIITGGPYTLSISPSLPSGLSFDNTTGVFSGTPLFNQDVQTYYISVSNSSGADVIEITIGIADVAPILNYAETNLTYVRGFWDTPLHPILSGGNVASWEMSPSLPPGLIFSSNSSNNFEKPLSTGPDRTLSITESGKVLISTWSGMSYLSIPSTVSVHPIAIETSGSRGNTGSLSTHAIRFDDGSVWWNNTFLQVYQNENVIDVALAERHWCYLLDSGIVRCWGHNLHGGFGDGTPASDIWRDQTNTSNVTLPAGRFAIEISSGGGYTCAILDNMELFCWGDVPSIPSLISANNITQLDTGYIYGYGICALLDIGVISCSTWAGNGGNYNPPTGRTFKQLGGGKILCALLDNNSVVCYSNSLNDWEYVQFPSGIIPSYLSVRWGTACVIIQDGRQMCWGDGNFLQLGNGNNVDSTTPVFSTLPSGESIHRPFQIGCIFGSSQVSTNAITYTVWANNSLGSSHVNLTIMVLPGVEYPSTWLNLTRNVTMSPFLPVININDINLSIHPPLPAGLVFNYTTGEISGTPLVPWQPIEYTVSLWNSSGYDTFKFTLFVSEILPNATYEHSNHDELVGFAIEPIIASNDAGTVHQWGISPSLPAGLDFLTYAVGQTFSAGQSSTCAIYSDDTLRCWGANDMGQLGDGNVTSSSIPVLVNFSDGATPVEVAVGGEHACAIMNDGSVRCWGRNDVGQVGRGTVCIYGSFADGCNGNFGITASSTVLLPTDLNATSISAGISHTCALMENGAVYCWGSNSNLQNGDGTSDDLATPAIASLPVGRYAVSLGVGNTHSCAVLDNGSAICWGANSFGQLGDGSAGADATYQFVQLPAGRSIVEIRGGGAHTCVLLDAGDVACWGRNTHGQLGDGTTIGKITPLIITLPGTLSATSIALGDLHSCALFDSGEIACWGSNQNGLIGGGGQYNATPSMLVLPDGLSLLSLSAGEGHTCGLTSTSRLVCIGDNGVGQLGDGSQINQPSLDYVVSIQGAIITTPHLPAGSVYGTPETILPSTTYTIYANNSIGQTNFPLTLSIQIPLEYSTNSLILLRDRVMTVETPNIANGEFSLLTITPTLIEGITLDSTTGVLSGIPLYNSTLTNYTITLSNSSGFYSIAISIVIYEPAANISYLAAPFSFTRGVDIGEHTPVVEGGVIEFWQIEPSLPQGLIFTEGMISGTPLVNLSTTTFRVWGNNSGGVGWIDIQITILEPAPILTLQTYELTLTRGESELNLSVTNLGGMVSNWSISPALPAGLIFTDGRITGVPLVNLSTTTYVLSSENSGGQHSISFNITINEPLPNIEYDPSQITMTRGEIFDMIVAYDTGGMIENWIITPALPSGLMFSDGTISGLSAVNSTTITYTITAMNSGGLASWIITIEILEPAPLITYSNNTLQLTKGKPMNSLVPSNEGGLVATWSISPALPAGLFFDSGSGVISGSPLVTSQATVYTIIATSNGGESTFTIIIEIRDPLPEFSLPLTYLRLTEGVVMPQLAPIPSGVVITGWSLTTDGQGLPSGLQFSATTGVISGTPLLASEAIKVTIIATNGGGQVFRNLTIVVLADYDGDAIPDVNDEDDDNDGFSDSKEKKEGTDPLNEESVPVEGFEIIVPGTSVSLGAWDILGVLSGVPLITWLMFSLATRNGRTQRFTVQLKEARTREEVEEIAERYGHALMIKLIGPHQGMRLERIRMEKDASLKEQDNVDPVEELQMDAEPILTLDQTSVLEEAMKEDDLDKQSESEEDENSVVESTPAIDLKGIPDESGFEWTNLDGVQWYRVSGSGDDWIKWSS